MPRKKSNLSRSTSRSRMAKSRRAKETENQRIYRLATDAARRRERRSRETSVERYNRLALNAARVRNRRKQEAPDQKQNRQAKDAARHNLARSQETPAQRLTRLAANAARQMARRASESPAQRMARQAANAARQRLNQAQEAPEHRQIWQDPKQLIKDESQDTENYDDIDLVYPQTILKDEIITDDVPTQETLMPVPIKLVEVSTGKEIPFQDPKQLIKDESQDTENYDDIDLVYPQTILKDEIITDDVPTQEEPEDDTIEDDDAIIPAQMVQVVDEEDKAPVDHQLRLSRMKKYYVNQSSVVLSLFRRQEESCSTHWMGNGLLVVPPRGESVSPSGEDNRGLRLEPDSMTNCNGEQRSMDCVSEGFNGAVCPSESTAEDYPEQAFPTRMQRFLKEAVQKRSRAPRKDTEGKQSEDSVWKKRRGNESEEQRKHRLEKIRMCLRRHLERETPEQ